MKTFNCRNKVKALFCLEQQKNSLAWENNYRYIFHQRKQNQRFLFQVATDLFLSWPDVLNLVTVQASLKTPV